MNTQQVVAQQLAFWQGSTQSMVAECSPEDLNRNIEGATVSSIASIYAHAIWSEDTIVNVIAKSGVTAETMATFAVVRQWMIDALGPARARERFVVTTDPRKGDLLAIASPAMITEPPREPVQQGQTPPTTTQSQLVFSSSSAATASSLCVPVQALIDYKGYRLIAMPLLPISRQTLAYGSNDGGQTVHARDAR